jgi:hypothetical protein
MNKTLLLGLLIWATVISSVWAKPDLSTFPDPVKPGSIQISLGGPAAPSFMYPSGKNLSGKDHESYAGVLFGGFARVDYALPLPFTVGIEGGCFSGRLYASNEVRFSAVPLMGRFSWHPNLGVKNLDIYAGPKMGLTMLFYRGSYDSAADKIAGSNRSVSWGFAFGSDCGVRCFFTPAFGMFVDLDVTIVLGKMQGTGITTMVPRPSVGLTVNL